MAATGAETGPAGLAHSPPPHRARDSRGHRRCYTRVQEIARGGKLRVWRFRSWNRGEWGSLPHRSKQSDSGAPSTSTGQSQLWKLTKCNSQSWHCPLPPDSSDCTLSIGRGDGTNGSRRAESGPVSRSLPVLALRRRLGRSPGPGRLTPQVSAGDHSGQEAKPAPRRLLLLGGVRRRPAIVRWSPRQLFPSLRFAATHRIAALAVECAQSQRGIRPLIALRRDAAPYRPSPHRAAQGCGVL